MEQGAGRSAGQRERSPAAANMSKHTPTNLDILTGGNQRLLGERLRGQRLYLGNKCLGHLRAASGVTGGTH
jgi:hypothetical protein